MSAIDHAPNAHPRRTLLGERLDLRRFVRLAGGLLAVVALAFLIRELIRQAPALSTWRPSAWTFTLLCALAIAHGSALFLLAEAWHRIVGIFAPEPRHRTWPSYTVTQVARYLPGNVAHLLGRAVWLRGTLDTATLTRATLVELAVVPLGGVLALAPLALVMDVAALEPALQFVGLKGLPPVWLSVGALSACATGLLVVATLLLGGPRSVGRLAAPTLLTALFMAWLGGSFAVVVHVSGLDLSSGEWPLMVAAAILAWLVGYATPGAPGGLGVREAVLVMLAGGLTIAGEATAAVLLAAIIHRLVTTCGDAVCFAAGWATHQRKRAISDT